MDKIRTSFNELPGTVKVLIYAGISQALGIVVVNLNNLQSLDWRAVIAVLIGIIINILGYLVLREKDNG